MSVVVIVKMKVEREGMEKLFANRSAEMEAVAAEARSLGAKRHCFAYGDGEAIVIDEWESGEAFQSFFDNNTQIPNFMQEAGAAGPPAISILEVLDSPDRF